MTVLIQAVERIEPDFTGAQKKKKCRREIDLLNLFELFHLKDGHSCNFFFFLDI